MQLAGNYGWNVVRLAMCGLACLLLTGCFFMPGIFQSELDIRRDGRFTYRYTGEVIFAFPPHQADVAWNDGMAQCLSDNGNELRVCSKIEIAEQRRVYEREQDRSQEAGRDISNLIGFNPVDSKSNEKLAAELAEYPGWKRVTYKGGGTFYVEYELSGTLDRDFAFPVLPQVQLSMPFVNVALKKAGILNISAAGLASLELRRLISGKTPKADQDDPYFLGSQSILNRVAGKLVVTTDAPVVETNGIQSQSGGSKRVEWTIDGETSASPSLKLDLIR